MKLTRDNSNSTEANQAEDSLGGEWQKDNAGDYSNCNFNDAWRGKVEYEVVSK